MVANFHAMLAGSAKSALERNADWAKLAQAFEDAVNIEIVNCYDNIDSYIQDMVEDSKYQGYSTAADGAYALRIDLMEKFPWVDWVTFGYSSKMLITLISNLLLIWLHIGIEEDENFESYTKWHNLPGGYKNDPDADDDPKKYIRAIPRLFAGDSCANETSLDYYRDWLKDQVQNSVSLKVIC